MRRLAIRYSLTLVLMTGVGPPFAIAPSSPAAPPPMVPAILGTWQAGHVYLIDSRGNLQLDRTPVSPDLSDRTLMPYGQRLNFSGGYDKEAEVAYWQIQWLAPFPANACQFPFLQFHCTEIKGVRIPRQVPIDLEYQLQISQDDIASFFPVGATKTERMYYLRCGGDDEWTPELYVSKDRQRMWISVGIAPLRLRPDGKFDILGIYAAGLQEYHRVAAYKRR